jgi:proliferating cell nuclear antigen
MNLEIYDITKAEIFVSCFHHMKLFTETVNILFQPEQLFVQCVDSAAVVIFEIVLPKAWFDVYSLKEDETVIVGLNTQLFFKVLNSREKTQRIQMNTRLYDHLCVDFISDDNGKERTFDKHFEIPMLDIESEMLHIPPIDYQAEFSLPSVLFASLISELKQFGDDLQIECTEEKISLVSNSLELGKMYTNISIEELQEYAIVEGETLKMSFSLKYLQYICAYQKVAKHISICCSNEIPIRLQYLLGTDAKMTFYLAPRILDE